MSKKRKESYPGDHHPLDHQFLTWLRNRLVCFYGESPNVDFVLRLEKIARSLKRKKL